LLAILNKSKQGKCSEIKEESELNSSDYDNEKTAKIEQTFDEQEFVEMRDDNPQQTENDKDRNNPELIQTLSNKQFNTEMNANKERPTGLMTKGKHSSVSNLRKQPLISSERVQLNVTQANEIRYKRKKLSDKKQTAVSLNNTFKKIRPRSLAPRIFTLKTINHKLDCYLDKNPSSEKKVKINNISQNFDSKESKKEGRVPTSIKNTLFSDKRSRQYKTYTKSDIRDDEIVSAFKKKLKPQNDLVPPLKHFQSKKVESESSIMNSEQYSDELRIPKVNAYLKNYQSTHNVQRRNSQENIEALIAQRKSDYNIRESNPEQKHKKYKK